MAALYDHAADLVRHIYDRRIDSPPVLDAYASFPNSGKFIAAWRDIRAEALAVAAQIRNVPRFHEIMKEQADISANDGRDWRMFILKAYGVESPRNMNVCPTLASIVAGSPDVLSASLSFLAPGKRVPSHRGPFRGVLRFYLALSMPLTPDGRPGAVLTVAGREYRLSDGEYLLWDDTYPHAVRNDSEETRIVLLLDVWRRGMPFDMEILSRILMTIIRIGIRFRGLS
jgi:aspartate beta-hydroxylase